MMLSFLFFFFLFLSSHFQCSRLCLFQCASQAWGTVDTQVEETNLTRVERRARGGYGQTEGVRKTNKFWKEREGEGEVVTKSGGKK